jgi:ATP-dependent DNA ligase
VTFNAGTPFVMDVKLDGERMMFHCKNGQLKIFTRNRTEYTDAYRELGATILHSILSSVTECILDGEVCALDAQTNTFMRFGSNSQAATMEREAYQLTGASSRSGSWRSLDKWLVFIVFDVVYLDGSDATTLIRDACIKFRVSLDQWSGKGGDITQFPLVVRRDLLQTICSFIGSICISLN